MATYHAGWAYHDISRTRSDIMHKDKGFPMVKLGSVSAFVRRCRGEWEYLYRLVKRLSGEM
jgi:hypothetical protein